MGFLTPLRGGVAVRPGRGERGRGGDWNSTQWKGIRSCNRGRYRPHPYLEGRGVRIVILVFSFLLLKPQGRFQFVKHRRQVDLLSMIHEKIRYIQPKRPKNISKRHIKGEKAFHILKTVSQFYKIKSQFYKTATQFYKIASKFYVFRTRLVWFLWPGMADIV